MAKSPLEIARESGVSRLRNIFDINDTSSVEETALKVIVLHMTTYCENETSCTFRIDQNGASIGHAEGGDSSIRVSVEGNTPGTNHATVWHEDGAFFLLAGLSLTGTYIRLSFDQSGRNHWPLEPKCQFRVGMCEFEVIIDDDATRPPSLALMAKSGKLVGQTFKVDVHGTSIGRSTSNKIHTRDKEMSRRHALIRYDHSSRKFYLGDIGSTNGSFMRLSGPYNLPYRLAIGDQILMAKNCFTVSRE